MLRIDLGCSIPFRTIPPIIELGFQKLDKAFVRGDPKVLEHYHMARIILEQCLGDPIYDVMLMMILTLSSSSVTPTVAVKSTGFVMGERKDPALFSANLTTRMLWFLCPEKFPWEKDDGMVLRVSEMTKKIEHKGVNNRVLRELGWVQVVKGHRDSPRNSELSLWPRTDLLSMRRELLPLMKNNAEAFIARIFRSRDSIWLERCSHIVRDVD